MLVCMNMAKTQSIPMLRGFSEKGKITLSIDQDVHDLYRIGKNNGWNTPEIVRQAINAALKERADTLMKSARETA